MAGRHRRVRSSEPGRHRKPPRRGHVAVPAIAAAAVLGLGGVGASAALSGGSHADSPPPTATLRPITPTFTGPPLATPTPAVSPSQAPSAAAAAATPDFAITVTGRICWVQVVGPHGRVLVAAIVRHGRTLTYAQRPLSVTLGDAGAVRLVLRHHVHARAGRPGQVLRFTVR